MYNRASYSTCSWIYPNSDGESDTGRWYSKGNSYIRVDSQSGNTVKVSALFDLATTDATFTSTSTIPTGAWSHICVAYKDDANDEITMYINGKLEGSSTNGVGSPASDTSSTLYIGGNNGANTFDGKIDDFKIFNYDLTPELVKQQYQQGAAVRFGPVEGEPD